MKNKTALLLASFLLTCGSFQVFGGGFDLHAALANPLQSRMLADLAFIEESFAVKYAPSHWKNQFCGWTLKAASTKVKNAILANPKITLKEYQRLLKEFFASAKDYHVGVLFYSTERSSLPFLVKKAEGHYFISYIDREKLAKPPFSEGDEIVTFDGKPIETVIADLKRSEMISITPETDQLIAELTLTQRSGQKGHVVPSGDVKITIAKGNLTLPCTLKWDYTSEKIVPNNSLGIPLLEQSVRSEYPLVLTKKESDFFNKMLLLPQWQANTLNLHNHSMGAKQSYLPEFGKKIWESGKEALFDAYVFEMPRGYSCSGKRIGYIRIANYVAGKEEVQAFRDIVSLFQSNVDALVIDQINNPGGSVFYLYALASLLTDRPLTVPFHHVALTQQEVYSASMILDALQSVKDKKSAVEVLGEEIGGYEVDYPFAQALKGYCEEVLQEWNVGHIYTKALPLFGVSKIRPDSQAPFSHPILILTNGLDFSGGDFFPAIMQDNKRATIFGTRTAGAGGYVVGTQYVNRLGVAGFTLTGSLAERENLTLIENLGVTPDVSYTPSKKDLQDNYSEYKQAVLKTLERLVK